MTWQEALRRAKRRAKKHPVARYAQLATVDEGEARCRTVVVRGIDDDGIGFVTDGRSAKVGQLAANDRAELCWYFVGLREQFRLRGLIETLEGGARAEAWAQLSPPGRGTFFNPPPGTPRSEEDTFVSESHAPEPPDTFVAMALRAERVERLELRPSPHERTAWTLDGEAWVEERLRP